MAQVVIRSELNAVVLEIVAAVGAEVEEDDTVIVLEAMKMEQNVPAPRRGQVTEIRVEAGQLVNEGDVLATLEY